MIWPAVEMLKSLQLVAIGSGTGVCVTHLEFFSTVISALRGGSLSWVGCVDVVFSLAT